jgi:hypothetical protein
MGLFDQIAVVASDDVVLVVAVFVTRSNEKRWKKERTPIKSEPPSHLCIVALEAHIRKKEKEKHFALTGSV